MERNVSGKCRKSQYWQHHVDGWHQSGQTQKAYCRANSLALATFCYWKRKLASNESVRRFYPLTVPSADPVAKTPQQNSAPLFLHIDRFHLEIREGYPPELLREVITTLAEVSR